MSSPQQQVPTRAGEIARYVEVYRDPGYAMGRARLAAWEQYLHGLRIPVRSLCDVATGRGEALGLPLRMGIERVVGYEVVPYLCDGERVIQIEGIHALPASDGEFDIVSCQDVMEHLVEADVVPGLRELLRVAARRVYLSVAWFPSSFRSADGEDLHITKHPQQWWEKRILEAIGERKIGYRVLHSARQHATIEVLL